MSAERYGFFDSTEADAREYTDADMSRFARILGRDGVRETGDNLRVEPSGMGLSVQIGYGTALVRGYYYELADDGGARKSLTLQTAEQNPRIDRVVLRLNLDAAACRISAELLKGAEAASPAAPALTRTSKIWEISLARIAVGVGASVIDADDIADERGDEAVCGVLHPDVAALADERAALAVRQGVRGAVFEIVRRDISVPVTGWTKNAQGWQERTVDCAGTVAGSAVQRVDVAVQGAQIGNVLLAGARCDANGKLTLVCLAVPPAGFEIMVIVSEVRT